MTESSAPVRKRLEDAARWNDDSDWQEVRRLARRRSAPLALVVVMGAAVVIAAPAFALRHQISAWIASPETNHYPWIDAHCGRAPFTLQFDPSGETIVRAGNQKLARASVGDRAITCSGQVVGHLTTPDESPYRETNINRRRDGATATVTVTCSGDLPLAVEVNPVYGDDSVTGSSLLVADPSTKEIIAGASYQRDPSTGHVWASVGWDSRLCSS
jgi:hypothetical protein